MVTLIREASLRDEPKLLKLFSSLWMESPPVALELGWALRGGMIWRRWFDTFFDQSVVRRNMAFLLVAEEKGEIVGFASLVVPKWRLLVGSVGIAVRRDRRRKRIGSLLLDGLLRCAGQTGLRVAVADVWSNNWLSMTFFRHNGFSLSMKVPKNRRRKMRLERPVFYRPGPTRINHQEATAGSR